MTIIAAAVVLTPGSEPQVRQVELGALRPNELLVKIDAAGICHTDLSVAAGHIPAPFPVVLGHEGAGTVEDVGEQVDGINPGTRVVLCFDRCGSCRSCLTGRPSACSTMIERNFRCSRSDGTTSLSTGAGLIHSHFLGQSAFATHAIVPAHCAIPINSKIPASVLAPFGCGIQTGAGAVMNTLKVAEGSSILVLGLGAVGLAAVMAARVNRAETIIAIDPVASRRELALELGATHILNPSDVEPLGGIRSIVGDSGVQYAVEASGVDGAFVTAVESLAPGGAAAVVGSPPVGVNTPLHVFGFVSAAKSIHASLLGDADPHEFIPDLVKLWEIGEFPVEKLIRTFRLDEIGEAISASRRGSAVKPVLRC